jgi:hypothetical protein
MGINEEIRYYMFGIQSPAIHEYTHTNTNFIPQPIDKEDVMH